MSRGGLPLLEDAECRKELKRRCREAKVPIATFEALIDAELEQLGKLKKRGIGERFDEILGALAGQTDADLDD